VRKHCSAEKGGGLARAAAGAAGVWTLLLSDVVGDDPATIASGPTAADPSTYAGALAALARHGALAAAPAVRAHLERGRAGTLPETAKPGDAWVARVRTVVVGSNADATAAAAAAARSRSYAVAPWPRPLAGPAADAGRALARALLAAPAAGAIAVVAGGETTVRAVPGSVGGRSQHLALAAATVLDGAPAALLAAGTDGVDGPTDAAGALVDGGTLPRARSLGIDVAAALESTASHRVLDATGDLVRTGPTGTNVADLVVALRAAP
jgi:glycerate-2-kinase